MNKYIRAAVCLGYTDFKFMLLKLIHGNKFKCSIINICSPFTEVDNRGGTIIFGKNLKMRSNSHIRVRKNGVLKISDNVSLGYGDMIVCHNRIEIGEDVQLSPNVMIYDHDHDFRTTGGIKAGKFKTEPIKIGNNVWIGANSIILRGTIIGDNAVIGAGCVVKGIVPENSVFVQKRESSFKVYESN